jgi:hypothetical protein
MRKLILITNDLYVRSFIQTDAFSLVDDEETFYAASENVVQRSELEALPNYVGAIPDPADRQTTYAWIRAVLQAHHRFRSRTQQIKIAQTPARQRRRLKLQALPVVRGVLIKRWLRKIGVNRELHALMQDLRPDVVICPSSGTDGMVVDAIRSARELGVASLVLVNGWDNLASKTGFSARPDYLGVWGEQSVDHAVRLHEMPRERVFPLGVPTFRHHFAFDEAKSPSPYPFPYVLFAGCSLAFDELTALHRLDDVVERLGTPGLKTVYRPHPWRVKRECPDMFREEDFRGVVLDGQIADAYMHAHGLDRTAKPRDFLPELEYYPSLLGHAELIVCPLSTMIVEAAIVERPVVVLAYDDGIHEVPPNLVAEFDHFEGMDRIEGFEIVRDAAETEAAVRAIHGRATWPSLREQVRGWLYYDERGYEERLRDLVDRIERDRGPQAAGPGAAPVGAAQRDAVEQAPV